MGEEDEEHKRRRDHADAAKAERRLNVPEREVVPRHRAGDGEDGCGRDKRGRRERDGREDARLVERHPDGDDAVVAHDVGRRPREALDPGGVEDPQRRRQEDDRAEADDADAEHRVGERRGRERDRREEALEEHLLEGEDGRRDGHEDVAPRVVSRRILRGRHPRVGAVGLVLPPHGDEPHAAHSEHDRGELVLGDALAEERDGEGVHEERVDLVDGGVRRDGRARQRRDPRHRRGLHEQHDAEREQHGRARHLERLAEGDLVLEHALPAAREQPHEHHDRPRAFEHQPGAVRLVPARRVRPLQHLRVEDPQHDRDEHERNPERVDRAPLGVRLLLLAAGRIGDLVRQVADHAARTQPPRAHLLVHRHRARDALLDVVGQREHGRRRRALLTPLDARRLLDVVGPAGEGRLELLDGPGGPRKHALGKGEAHGAAERLHHTLGVLEQIVRVDDRALGARLVDVAQNVPHLLIARLDRVKMRVARAFIVDARLVVERGDGLCRVAHHEAVHHRVARRHRLRLPVGELLDAVRRDVVAQVL
mmetsp:Transcript_47169/g.139137  ORF Transcript_47169/g.139137 Transcript_47169/m.139137 type:complete len:538 (-) Transcript_47169:165-1778(-)